MIPKSILINSFNNLPECLTLCQVTEHIIFVEKVQMGISDSRNGLIHTKEEARKKLGKWIQ
jgi:hypothetical protein